MEDEATKTSAEQLAGAFSVESPSGSDERLFIDLDVCSEHRCPECAVECSYDAHPGNNGVYSVAELATYALVCRRCEEPHCVMACPVGALEQQADKGRMLVRHNLLCIGCLSCSLACPYGTIYPELVPVRVHNCDFCLDRRSEDGQPLCVATCPHGALRLVRADLELDENTFRVGDRLIVHSTHWEQEKA